MHVSVCIVQFQEWSKGLQWSQNQANTNTHDSGYHSLTPIPTVPVGNHQTSISTHGYDFGSLHQHHLQHRMSSGSHATEGSDASIMSRNTRAYRPATRKRRRDHLSSQSGNPESPQRSNKAQRLDRDSAKPQGYEFIPVDSESALADSRWMPHPVTPNSRFSHGPKLDRKQKAFIRRWFEGFYDGQASLDLANKDLTALATLSKAPTQSIRDYLNKKCVNRPEAQRQGDLSVHRQRLGTNCLPEPDATYSFREANQHLTPTTLQQVEKYVKAFGKRRQPGDGRRKVNRGPFRCTFKCGYRTKRPFDWRRHEETHEPQELWLCHFCSQENEQTPFLVNRKDKLLQHAKDNHKGRNPEEAVEKSRVDFRPKPNTRCPLCFENSDNWDERCKHIISHYEDQQMHAKSRHRQNPRARGQRSSDEDSSEPKENDTSDDTSDDEDDDPGSLQDRPPGGDPTGGAGGGSAGPSALYPYKGSDDYHLGNGTSGGAASYDYPSNGYSSHSFGVFSMAATSFEDPVVEASSGTALHSRAYFVQPSYSRVHLGK
ncbi:hypothetical protein K491DRAFT_517708 [Lophiostoma macrostomum CBS 122681]|uniref:C2H2-type domain-containing protein n=1 Tax=Lophiostoma macrostomum CBS 122681 TaxID=1314788 RepID=A0A6A6T0R5_9PLEO|nr:hypothetical protein K491DRAFT_517708 [Lophiostoma macrostomum CBS 122681]